MSLGIHYNAGHDLLDYVLDNRVLMPVGDWLTLSDAPGLGVTIEERAVREADAKRSEWRNPIWRLADRSFAEW